MEVDISEVPCSQAMPHTRKRKGDFQENERLCKRVGLLNLEPQGPRLYVPVEAPGSNSRTNLNHNLVGTSTNPSLPIPPPRRSSPLALAEEVAGGGRGRGRNNGDNDGHGEGQTLAAPVIDEQMRLDDTPHKVYIYDLEAELAELSPSSDSCSDAESNSSSSPKPARLALLPDLERHLRNNRLPRSVLRADETGKFAGKDTGEMQLVLYGAPRSLSVPEDRDGVRRAVVEARARAEQEAGRVQDRIREAQRRVREGCYSAGSGDRAAAWSYPHLEQDTLNGMGMNRIALGDAPYGVTSAPLDVMGKPVFGSNGFTPGFGPARGFAGSVGDDDAMDLDL